MNPPNYWSNKISKWSLYTFYNNFII